MRLITYYLVGLIFGLGISISGMGNPAKVVNFFDIAGTWDPSLIFVMGGALVVTFLGYRVVLGKPKPAMAKEFLLPSKQEIDLPLVGGAIIFGIGWGIGGFCPGGALPVIGTGKIEVVYFIAALLAGSFVARQFQARLL